MAEQKAFASVEFAMNPEQRCPCVLLLDTSGSMNEIVEGNTKDTGQTQTVDGKTYRMVTGGITKLHKLQDGLRVFRESLESDPLALQRLEISVITFGGRVETLTPFVTAREFAPPSLQSDGDTPMGEAIRLAIESVAARKQVYKENSIPYLRPWIFLITDGEPTDEWQASAELIKQGEKKKSFAFFSVGVNNANMSLLSNLSAERSPVLLSGTSFRELFVWLSSSLSSVSKSKPGHESEVQLPSPKGWATL